MGMLGIFRPANWLTRPLDSLVDADDDVVPLSSFFSFEYFLTKPDIRLLFGHRLVIIWLFSGCHLVIIQLSSGYYPVIIRLSSGYHPVIVRLSSDYRPIIVRLSSCYRPVIIRLWPS